LGFGSKLVFVAFDELHRQGRVHLFEDRHEAIVGQGAAHA
jgi:hypothetical protein